MTASNQGGTTKPQVARDRHTPSHDLFELPSGKKLH